MENIKPLWSPEFKVAFDKYSHFFVEVRKRAVFTFVVFAVTTFSGFIFYDKIIKFLVDLLSIKGINIVFTSPFQYINLAIACGVAFGIIITFPLLIVQILSFLKPALERKEYKTVLGLLPFSLVLFLVGFIFGAIIMKWQIGIFLDRSVTLGIGNILDISKLLNTVILTSILMGVGFQFPIVILLLLRLGIFKRNQLAAQRKWVYLASFIFAILLPPDSILADIFLSLPLIILFEVTLIIGRRK